jgi:predicted dehydrogenase
MNRRRFLRGSAAAALAFPAILRAAAPNSKVVVAVVGASRTSTGGDGRGSELAITLAGLRNVEVAAICDVDERHLGKAIEAVAKKGVPPPRGERDLRRLLEDKTIDAVVIATPDHWHGPAGILACAAGKHVYVENPCTHNAAEGEMLVSAARKHERVVQHGTQRRSWPAIREAIAKLHEGAIGRVLAARAHYFNKRPPIGRGKQSPPPPGLDWSLWQGPAPERPFQDNVVHRHWHWVWHWGTGELGSNGVHMLDLCRWGLGVDFPLRVSSGGGKLRVSDDDQETPDTQIVTCDFGDIRQGKGSTITWESRSWSGRFPSDPRHDVAFYGEDGALLITGSGYSIHDPEGRQTGGSAGPGGSESHLQNFIDAIRGSAKLNAEIEEGRRSTLLCHLGNIAWRVNETVVFGGAQRRIVDNANAERFWKREYRPGWEPAV